MGTPINRTIMSQADYFGRCNDYLEREYIQADGNGGGLINSDHDIVSTLQVTVSGRKTVCK